MPSEDYAFPRKESTTPKSTPLPLPPQKPESTQASEILANTLTKERESGGSGWGFKDRLSRSLSRSSGPPRRTSSPSIMKSEYSVPVLPIPTSPLTDSDVLLPKSPNHRAVPLPLLDLLNSSSATEGQFTSSPTVITAPSFPPSSTILQSKKSNDSLAAYPTPPSPAKLQLHLTPLDPPPSVFISHNSDDSSSRRGSKTSLESNATSSGLGIGNIATSPSATSNGKGFLRKGSWAALGGSPRRESDGFTTENEEVPGTPPISGSSFGASLFSSNSTSISRKESEKKLKDEKKKKEKDEKERLKLAKEVEKRDLEIAKKEEKLRRKLSVK